MLCGHTDTVGVAGMAPPVRARRARRPAVRPRIAGHEGRRRGDAGRGTQSVEAAASTAGRLIVAAVVDEEHSSLGADALVRTWRADAAVVTEPTGLDVAVAHKGFQWVAVETRGRAAHGSRPLDGRDAILRMGRVLTGLEALDRALHGGRAHPLLGTASLHASLIHGGQELSSYPDRAWLEFERRTLPGEPASVAVDEVDRILEQLRAADPEFDGRSPRRCSVATATRSIRTSSLPAELTRAAAATRAQRRRTVGMTFWTDAAILGAAGIPAVIFGPGGAGLHSTEEYVHPRRCAHAAAPP